jgi:hypothetical protein
MTTKEFDKLEFGNLIYHEQLKRMLLVKGWRGKWLLAKPSLISIKQLRLSHADAPYLKHGHI